ncbi:MAG: hypothetical protein HFE63_06745 [Clostridiales bacterium]|nr:hypothetical protein [Clostridiales bacterium]
MKNSNDTRYFVGIALLIQAIANLYMFLVLKNKKSVTKAVIATAFVSSIASTVMLLPTFGCPVSKKRKAAEIDFEDDIDFATNDDEDIDDYQCC